MFTPSKDGEFEDAAVPETPGASSSGTGDTGKEMEAQAAVVTGSSGETMKGLTDGTSAPSDTTESSAAAGTTAGTTYPPFLTQMHPSYAKPQRSTRVDSSPGSHVSSPVPSDSRWVTITGAQMMLVVVGVAASTVGVTLGGLVAVCVRWRSNPPGAKGKELDEDERDTCLMYSFMPDRPTAAADSDLTVVVYSTR